MCSVSEFGLTAKWALDEIEVAAKTPQEVANLLGQSDVPIVDYLSRVYYILGQVNMPSPGDYIGRDTVLTALALAQPNVVA